eukprot:NODE_4497_length_778_cov_45.579109_g4474_i0.p1 GENE.NODE_4497_length_778_cov_45.579109_g4474_i0~~NODE_4497_length_778_cov_45.579109_g4474_i0.p1  ORF type:complete len:219 (+),score=48.22 NODE_4497_length_778_cov_45.579109_g4474_i0:78-734(+)
MSDANVVDVIARHIGLHAQPGSSSMCVTCEFLDTRQAFDFVMAVLAEVGRQFDVFDFADPNVTPKVEQSGTVVQVGIRAPVREGKDKSVRAMYMLDRIAVQLLSKNPKIVVKAQIKTLIRFGTEQPEWIVAKQRFTVELTPKPLKFMKAEEWTVLPGGGNILKLLLESPEELPSLTKLGPTINAGFVPNVEDALRADAPPSAAPSAEAAPPPPSLTST